MDWSQIKTWPLSDVSRQIQGPVHRWHAQEMGAGETLLLLHGAGGSTHSYRDVLPELADVYHVVALDLPGHGFTQLGARLRSGLQAMADDVSAVCADQGWRPDAIVGHSAGAAVALQMALDCAANGRRVPHIIGLNAALGTFPGLAGLVFPIMAKALAAMPFATALFSTTSANPGRIKSLIASTGSQLTPEGYDLYRRLVADKAHVDGTLQMMAQWQLEPLLTALPRSNITADLIVGARDSTVPPEVSETVAAKMAHAQVHTVPGLGHLMHEEAPTQISAMLLERLAAQQT